jgi:hypothetical protein
MLLFFKRFHFDKEIIKQKMCVQFIVHPDISSIDILFIFTFKTKSYGEIVKATGIFDWINIVFNYWYRAFIYQWTSCLGKEQTFRQVSGLPQKIITSSKSFKAHIPLFSEASQGLKVSANFQVAHMTCEKKFRIITIKYPFQYNKRSSVQFFSGRVICQNGTY